KSATLSLDGTGTSGSMGALHAGGGTGTTGQWSGNISLADNATITAADNLLIVGEGSTFSNTLSLGANTLTLHTPSAPVVTPTYEPFPAYTLDDSNIVINAKITGTGGVTKTGSGTASIIAGASGGNTFTGDTVVTGGTLILDGYNSTPAINSDNIFVGNAGANPGTADSIALQLGQLVNASGPQNAIGTWNAGTNASTSNMTVYSDGVFKMNNASTGFANLTLQGGHVDQGAISSNPLLTLTGTVTTNASSRTALIDNGNLAMSANNFTFTIASGTTASGVDLQIDSILQTGGGYTGGSSGTSLVKAGTGTLALTNLNNYAGITNVSAGVLNIRHDSALGQTGSFAGDTANGTVVQSGAQLQLEGGITIGSFESLILNGTGVSTSGAMRNVGGSNSYLGLVTLGSASTITANSGTSLTLSGGIATSGNTLTAGTVANNGNITISGSVSGGGNLIKNGANTLTLSGSTTTLGTVTMNAGTLNFNGTTATTGAMHLLGGATSVGGSTTLNTGAIDAVAGTTLTIASGGSVVADYASGTTTFSGALAGGGGFEKTGAGTLVFDNPFTASSLTLTLNGGTLSLLGGAFSVGTIHITGDTILDFNNSAGTFFSSTSLVIEAGVTVTVNNWISVANNSALSTIWYATSTINGGSLGGSDIKGGTPLSQIEFSNFDGLTTTWVSSDHDGWFDREIRPTPEPATYGAMFLGGCLGLLGWRRWRARHPACGRV
ncbi:MAG: autotransporter-associated beta strand repeat-containing protein, partial [Opitutus sp.]